MGNRKQLPQFKTEAHERAFWESNDSTEYLDWSAAKKVVMPNLKASTKTISPRLSEMLFDSIKQEVNEREI